MKSSNRVKGKMIRKKHCIQILISVLKENFVDFFLGDVILDVRYFCKSFRVEAGTGVNLLSKSSAF